jgi:DNA-binding response OmpR family regulator
MTISGKILIIDDEPSLQQTFTRILRQAGHQVTTAGDGDEALKRLAGTMYDLAYLDIRLPGKDGVEVLKEIHLHYPNLPVILFTGHASLQTAMDAIRFGATDYLVKPIAPEALISRTEVVLTQQAKQRRKREVQEQITALQEELKALDTSPENSPPPSLARLTSDRYLTTGQLSIDLQTRRASFSEAVLNLPPATFDYLVVLARHTPDTVSYQTLVTEAQGYHTDSRQAQELAKWHIHELRRAIEPNPRRPRYIINERGTGYRLITD